MDADRTAEKEEAKRKVVDALVKKEQKGKLPPFTGGPLKGHSGIIIPPNAKFVRG
jgi:hypothetical protein